MKKIPLGRQETEGRVCGRKAQTDRSMQVVVRQGGQRNRWWLVLQGGATTPLGCRAHSAYIKF